MAVFVQSPFTEDFYGYTLPMDILNLIANTSPKHWYLMSVANKSFYKIAKEKTVDKKREWSTPYLRTEKQGSEQCSRLPNMRRHGNYKKISGSIVLEGQYIDGKKEGSWKKWDNGILSAEYSYKNDNLDGIYIIWDSTTGMKISESFFINGKMDGFFTSWHKNGRISVEGSYSQGKKKGKWIYTDLKGQKSIHKF